MTRPRALVIGGSVGGLFAANLLRAIGWNVTVFERAAGDLGDRGAGIGTRPELFAVMRRIGLDTDASIGIEVQSRICLDRTAASFTRCRRARLPALGRSSGVRSSVRCRRIATAPGAELKGVEQDAASVTAIFADGTRAQGDLLVAADGIHSTVRQQFLPAARAGLCRVCGLARRRDRPGHFDRVPFNRLSPHDLLLPTGRADPLDPDAGPRRRPRL